jgi:hypothetical protein
MYRGVVSPQPEFAHINLDDLEFGPYWPKGSPELVREYLRREYDPTTMPPLTVNRRDGKLWLLGWANEDSSGLLEAARAWGFTTDEKKWVEISARVGVVSTRLGSGELTVLDGSHRQSMSRRLAKPDDEQ